MPAAGSWKTTSGLLDDFDFDIEEAWFGTNESFGDACLLNLRGPASQEGEIVDEEHTEIYTLGDGWEPAKGGTIASHKSGKVNFNDRSRIGLFINSLVGLGDDVIGVLQARGETFEAATWQGLRLHIERKKFTYKDRQTGEEREYEVPLPTAFLGVIDGEEAAAPKAKPAPKPKPKPKPKAKGSDLRAAVVEFASQYEDHAEFVDAVFDEDVFDRAGELHADEELTNDVLDEDESVWQESRG